MRPLAEHVHHVGPQLGQQAVVVRDGEHAEVLLVRRRLDPTGDGAQRVDVEARVDLVEHRDLGARARASCSVSLRLRSPPDRSTLSGAVEEALVEAEALGFRLHPRSQACRSDGPVRESAARERVPPARRRALRSDTACARNSPRWARCHGRRPSNSSPSSVTLPSSDLVARASGEHVGERRLARTVRPHDHVHLAGTTVRSMPRRISCPPAAARSP